jgi:hypothetical protein
MTAFSTRYLIHQYKFNNANNHNLINIKVNLKTTYDPRIAPIYLQIFNLTTSIWETIATGDYGLPDTDFDLQARVTTNVQNYYDVANNNQVTIRVYQLNSEL